MGTTRHDVIGAGAGLAAPAATPLCACRSDARTVACGFVMDAAAEMYPILRLGKKAVPIALTTLSTASSGVTAHDRAAHIAVNRTGTRLRVGNRGRDGIATSATDRSTAAPAGPCGHRRASGTSGRTNSPCSGSRGRGSRWPLPLSASSRPADETRHDELETIWTGHMMSGAGE